MDVWKNSKTVPVQFGVMYLFLVNTVVVPIREGMIWKDVVVVMRSHLFIC